MFILAFVVHSPMLLLAAALVASVCVLDKGVSKTISRLDGLINPFAGAWRYKAGDCPGAEAADFDDSSWKKCAPGQKWEGEQIAWFRGVITIPEHVVGIRTIGSHVQFRAGIDQDGQIFVNGQLRQQFWRDHCNIVLTEQSEAGQEFQVAIRGSRYNPQGEFLWSILNIGAVSAAIPDVQDYILDFRFAEQLLEIADRKTRDKMELALASSAGCLDLKALEAHDIEGFRRSLVPARKALKPAADFAKKFKCHLVGHAHIDMNWLWLWPETVEVCQNTFTSMTDLMDEFPGFTFSQSQPTTYICVEDTMPDLFGKMKKAVKDGRWEITGGTWVEGDMNMASGESIVRQILYAKRYFRETFGKEPEVCWEPDTFGHAWTVPQILKKSGLKYYYHMRCGKGEMLYWWESPDGSRVLVYNDPSYSDNIRYQSAGEVIDGNKRYGVNDAMLVYGVGDHGGGPTRHDLETITNLQTRQVFPQFEYSTFYDYMSAVEARNTKIPVIRDEMNFIFEGCYTTHADIKWMNRYCENNLPAVEAFSVAAKTRRHRYAATTFREAWQITCFNQFHDIFDGSGIHGTYNYSRELYEKAEAAWTSTMAGSLTAIADDVNTASGEGTPVLVFNPLSWGRTEFVEVAASKLGKRGQFTATDEEGKTVPVQKIDDKLVFLAGDVPSLGYKVFWIGKKKAEGAPTACADGTTLENEFLKVKVHPKKGVITSIYDKVYGREIVPKGSFADQLQILMEKPHGMTAWCIGPISGSSDIKTAQSVEVVNDGPNYAAIQTKHNYKKSSFTQEITLKAGSRQVEIKLTADWYEQGTARKDAAMLKVAFPVDVKAEKTTYEIPFGSIQRDNTGAEYPGLKWIDQSEEGYGVSLLNSNKYGHDATDGQMRLTLLRSSYDPDPQPDQGVHEMTYVLYPHAGDWKQGETLRRAWELNNQLIPFNCYLNFVGKISLLQKGFRMRIPREFPIFTTFDRTVIFMLINS